jgi:CubicO group peptidase (beta-lactamase class C family)
MTTRLRLASALLLLVATAVEAAERIPEAVRDHVARRVDQGGTMGIVVGVVDATGTSYLARGRRSADGPPVGEDTLFEIGSITKVFTATLLADLEQRGVVGPDEPLARLLPPGARVPSRGERAIMLRDLATHRSGLPRLPDPFSPPDLENPYAAYSEGDLLAFLAAHALQRDPGAQYEYSNLGAGLLGYSLARRAGSSYEALVIERLAGPLGLDDTRITLSAEQRARLASGHAGRRAVAGWDFDALAGAGALRSTPRDLLRFVAANLGLVEGGPAAALRATHRDRVATGVPDLSVTLGWHLWTRHGATVFWHNGGTGGYRSFCGFDPERRRGVVVLANSSSDEIDDIGLHLLEPEFALAAVRFVAPVAAAALEELVGYYQLGPGVVVHVTREGDQLYAQLTGQERFPLFAESPLEFFYKVVDARISFRRGAGGAVDRLVLHQNGDHEAARVAGYQPPAHVEVEVAPAVLGRYVGRYELAPGVEFDVALRDGRLAVQLTGQPRFPVFAESPTRFFYKVVEAQLAFQLDAAGEVTGLVLHQSGVAQPARKIE